MMHILRLTALLSIACVPLLLPETVFGQSGLQSQTEFELRMSRVNIDAVPSTTLVAQATTTGQPAGTNQSPYTSPGSSLQTPGAGLPTPGTTQTTNGQPTNGQPVGTSQAPSGTTGNTGATGSTGTPQTTNGQPVQSSPSTTGTTQTPNGQPIGNQAAPLGSNGSQVSPGSVLYPPQIIQGGSTAAPVSQPPASTSAPGTVPIQPQSAPGAAATRTTAPSSRPQVTQTSLQGGQGALDASLQQATCAQNWRQAIRLVNTAIAASPAAETGYRTQLVAYRNRLQTLQARGVRAPNWAQQCRGGNVANSPAR